MADLASTGASVVVHAAAWTDVDGCAREPAVAMRRNGAATGSLARAAARAGIPMVFVSTNEVFDGGRTDGTPYGPADATNPVNPYGASKLAGERWATEELAALGPDALGIVRTAWLFGPGKPDFPTKIAAAARAAAAESRPLRVVADEIGTPTYVPDLAAAIVRLADAPAGIHHVVNAGVTSRAGWAREVVRGLGIEVDVEDIALADFQRASTAPPWGVLGATKLPGGPLRDWRAAMAERLADLRESAA